MVRVGEELRKAPLATSIAVVALIIAFFGSPFDPDAVWNPKRPYIVAVEQFSGPNDRGGASGYGIGRFATHITVNNISEIDANIISYAIFLDHDKDRIEVLNASDDEVLTKFFIQRLGIKSLVATSNQRPTYIILCLRAEATESSKSNEFQAVYSLMDPTPELDQFLSYRIENISGFRSEIDLCQSNLNI